jgi:hypothetical protein
VAKLREIGGKGEGDRWLSLGRLVDKLREMGFFM